jgi:hypothetical protein
VQAPSPPAKERERERASCSGEGGAERERVGHQVEREELRETEWWEE